MLRGGARRVRPAHGEVFRLADVIGNGGIITDLAATTREEALAELVGRLVELRPGMDREELLRRLRERERLGSTGIGGGVAIPHAKMPLVGKPLVVFGRSRTGIAFDSLDGRPVRLFFLLIADEESVDLHLRLLAATSRLLKNRELRDRLLEAADTDTLYGMIEEQDNRL